MFKSNKPKSRITISHSSLSEPMIFEFTQGDEREGKFNWSTKNWDGLVVFEAGVEDEKVVRIFGSDISMITEVGLDD